MGMRMSNRSFFALYAVLVFYFTLHLVPHRFLGVRASTVSRNETDRLALLDFKSKVIQDPLGALGSWNASIHFCSWHGVTCSRRHQQRVTILDLRSLKLSGSISPHIGNLSFLKKLYLENNSFTNQITSEVGRLQRLEVLFLHNNSIGGEIPANISSCSNLIQIDLSGNQLMGKIPLEISSLSKLEILALNSNYLSGSIPSTLGNLSSILIISLIYNNFSGSIPHSLSELNNLASLYLGANKLSGAIPSSIFNISSITDFDVGMNQIQGGLSLNFGFTLPNLRYFSVAKNQITGSIPPSLSNATKLEAFYVTENKLTGEVPSLGNLQRLQYFVITNNSLGSGGQRDLNFLCSLINATRLMRMTINANNFGGILPTCICNFSTTLEMLLLDGNKIVGSIPAGIGNYVNLQRLEMWDNQLSGTIPPAIGELQNLKSFGLSNNRLSGNIPPSIGKLKKLLQLFLSGNFLQGTIPSSLGQCKNLLVIDFSYNNLSGTIPPQLMRLTSLSIGLYLFGNQLTGSLPIEVGKLINLEILDVTWNMLEGEIPSTLGSCIRLEQLEMGGNLFQSSIPSSLSSLRGLRVLDLSQNNLTGEIPKFLAGLKLLQFLNLSYNNLEGMVPTEGIFKNASATVVLGNSKLCGGIPKFQLSTCGSKRSKERRLTLTLKLVIAIVSGLVGLALALSALLIFWVRKRKEKSNPSSSINSLQNLSYKNLYNATNGFSSANLIGAGSFGSVYKGIFYEGKTTIAVKVFNLHQCGASRSFIGECKALRNIRHRNLVKVLTVCSGVDYQGNDFKALVYEFMHNGSLQEWLHPVTSQDEADEPPRNLNLLQRLNIAIDVASALNYLHHDCQPIIAHCDLKPSNVLLDDDMTARLGDFGLARFLPHTHTQTSSIGIKGSIGYIAPEYGLGNEVSTNGDIYSYGILLLELVIRKKPSDITFEGDMNLHNFARTALPNHVIDIVDSTLLNDDQDLIITSNQRQREARINNIIQCLISMVRIGVACSMDLPQDRMNLTNVVHELKSVKNNLPGHRTVSTTKEVIK
ncbi:hypothetical protein WN944_018553 [Citrus x changshan-huyou]|uniref:non-specific serine/threonine protein kinase n=1 Tax=Citrus x changshan-huyou TaxID=2935761 RepID=A0AAP0LTN1_9ROSI